MKPSKLPTEFDLNHLRSSRLGNSSDHKPKSLGRVAVQGQIQNTLSDGGIRKSSSTPLLAEASSNSSPWVVPAALFVAATVCVGVVYQSTGSSEGPRIDEPVFKDSSDREGVFSRIRERLTSLDAPKPSEASSDPCNNNPNCSVLLSLTLYSTSTTESKKAFNPWTYNYETRDQRIGDPAFKIQPYAQVKDIASPQEYYEFLVANLQSPEEAGELASHKFVDYSVSAAQPMPPAEYLALGRAACVGFSILACEALESLGERTGTDYHPRVISQSRLKDEPGHAVCMYDDAGTTWVIDQSAAYPIGSIAEPEKISKEFVSALDMKDFDRTEVGKRGEIIKVSLDRDLYPNQGEITVYFPSSMSYDIHNFDFSFLPSDWRDYKTMSFCFGFDKSFSGATFSFIETCQQTALFQGGELVAITYKEGSKESEMYDNGQLVQEKFRNGPYQYVFYRDGEKNDARTFSGATVFLNE